MKVLTALVAAATASTSAALSETAKNNVRANFGDHRLITLPKVEVTDVVHEILNEHSYDDVGHANGEFHMKLPKQAVEALEKEGVMFSDKTEEFISNMERNLQSNEFVCVEDGDWCATQVPEVFYNSYQTLETIHERFRRFAVAYPEVTSYDTLGLSHEGREQKVLMIGNQTKPLVFYFCAIHAREWITPMFCTYMAETLLDTSNVESKRLLEKFSFAITPVANVDGYAYTHSTNTAWRKTRKPNPDSNCVGTDPNRNYASGWGGQGASSDPCSETFHGYEPFDQACTANIKAFTDANQDRLIHVNDVHAYGEYWMSPYASSLDLPPADDWAKMDICNHAVYDAIVANSGLEFKIGSVATTIYEAAGGAVDYFYEVNGIVHSYTYEARDGGNFGLAGFQPDTFNIMPSNKEMYAGLVAALDCIAELEFEQEVAENEGPSPERGETENSTEEEIGAGLIAGVVVLAGIVVALAGAVVSASRGVKKTEN